MGGGGEEGEETESERLAGGCAKQPAGTDA